jgi:17beta-estradiol 17-dehydrogenase / very-long-chain 3-oxoacyl-CoA reductase
MVTGASDGIGKEFAIQLAQKGFNLLLISRTASKLEALSQEIEDKHGIKTKVLAMDFAKNSDADYAKLKALVDGLDIALLVNNVGLSHAMPVPFLQTPKDEMRDIIMINCMATLRVTQIVAPYMVQRKRGLILTMGSMGGTLPTPLLATYSGSKAFLQQWSTALGAELKPHGIDVELVLSYLVTTSMSKIRRATLLVPNPRDFVKATLRSIGLSGGSQSRAYTSTPFWVHALMQWWLENTVGLMNSVVLGQNLRMHQDIRNRALRKLERDAKKAS